MNNPNPGTEPVRVRVSADVDAPDKVAYGLTFRQLAILAVAAVVFYTGWRALHTHLPTLLLVGVGVVAGGVTFGLTVGRRDGLPMDVWLLSALRQAHAPRALSTMDTDVVVPDWVDPTVGRVRLPAPLRLPARAIDDVGQIRLGQSSAAMVAVTTVNLALRTVPEQTVLIDTFGRWLNSLSTPTQIVVSAQPFDLHTHARTLTRRADRLTDPALAAACADHARFLDDLAHRRDPLRRQVLIVTRTPTTTGAGAAGGRGARRRADDTVRSLSALGVTARALDGPAGTAALTAAADPYRPARPGRPAAPDTVITTRPTTRPTTRGAHTYGGSVVKVFNARSRSRAGADRGGQLAATVAPTSVEVTPRYLRVGDGYAATLVVTGYPAEVGPAWLEPLLSWPGRLDVALHIDPIPARVAAARLRRQRARLESTRRADAHRRANSTTRASTPPPTTPPTWPTGSPAARRNCSASACT